MLTETHTHNFIMLALQYSLGNNSIVISLFVENLVLSWDSISQKSRDVLISFLDDEIKKHYNILKSQNKMVSTNLGEPHNADVWIKLFNFMKRNKIILINT
jgi:hypothetical protein